MSIGVCINFSIHINRITISTLINMSPSIAMCINRNMIINININNYIIVIINSSAINVFIVGVHISISEALVFIHLSSHTFNW